MKYKCTVCGQEHEGWPVLAYNSPLNYHLLSNEEKDSIAELTNDACEIRYPDQTDRFIRCTLIQKVIDHCENLKYGLWVSLSETSFKDYINNVENENHEAGYFGWLCNAIPEYLFSESIPVNVHRRQGNDLPEIVPHEGFDHPFVRDYYSGITREEAEGRIKSMLSNLNLL